MALTERQEYLDQRLQKLVSKQGKSPNVCGIDSGNISENRRLKRLTVLLTRVDKSEEDVESESQLLECRLTLTEERNAVLVPSAGSGIPGAPAEWSVPPCSYFILCWSLNVIPIK